MSRAVPQKSSGRVRVVTVFVLCWFASVASGTFSPPASAVAQRRVYGAIAEKWRQLNAESGPLGAPKTDELDAARGGRYNEFQNGFIYWHPSFGAHAVYGDIGVKWNQLGRERNLGYPLTDEKAAPNGGRYSDFENAASIYWHPRTGAHAVYGDIRKKWASMGGALGCLGYPTTDEFSDGRYRRTNFQKGYIRWTRQTGAKSYGCVQFDNGTELNPVDN